ncbi:MAG TPA: hypothetical protein VFB85_03935, partial [Vicinamibacterales bacterium]|nr:hypothetical protein [Vicinamibacterales bacterium]
MRAIRIVLPVLTLPVLCACAMSVAEARQNTASSSAQAATQTPQQVTVPLSDPSRPATLRVNLMWGGVTIRGSNRKDVLIEAQSATERRGRGVVYSDGGGVIVLGRGRSGRGDSGRSDSDTTGLRRLTQPGGFSIEENNNEIVLSSGWNNRGLDFTIEMPARANLKLSTLNAGPIVVENIDGEIEVNNQNESITMTNVSGSVVANAHNGRLKVEMTRVSPDKPMAFTTFNGPVEVTLPSTLKANLRLRSDHGEILSDFDIQVRPVSASPSQNVRGPDGRIRIEVNQSIQGTVNGGGPEFEFRSFNG